MPKKGKKPVQKHSDIVEVKLKLATTGSLVGGALTIPLQPSSFNQVSGLADNYEFYRVTRLMFRIQRSGTITGNQTMCYVAGVTDTPPSSASLASQALDSCVVTTTTTVPSNWVSVPNSRLASYQQWFKTIVGSPDPSVENQGNIFFGGSGTDGVFYEIKATYQFRVPCNTALTPMERGQKILDAERARMLNILGSAAPKRSPTAG